MPFTRYMTNAQLITKVEDSMQRARDTSGAYRAEWLAHARVDLDVLVSQVYDSATDSEFIEAGNLNQEHWLLSNGH